MPFPVNGNSGESVEFKQKNRMKRLHILWIFFFLSNFWLAGCQSRPEVNEFNPDRVRLNDFILEDLNFEWTPLAEVLNYVESEINKQSDDYWEIRFYETPSQIISFRHDKEYNSMPYSGIFNREVGVGDFFLFLNEWTNTKYEVENNVIYFSRRVDY